MTNRRQSDVQCAWTFLASTAARSSPSPVPSDSRSCTSSDDRFLGDPQDRNLQQQKTRMLTSSWIIKLSNFLTSHIKRPAARHGHRSEVVARRRTSSSGTNWRGGRHDGQERHGPPAGSSKRSAHRLHVERRRRRRRRNGGSQVGEQHRTQRLVRLDNGALLGRQLRHQLAGVGHRQVLVVVRRDTQRADNVRRVAENLRRHAAAQLMAVVVGWQRGVQLVEVFGQVHVAASQIQWKTW